MLRLALLPADFCPAARTLSVIGHGEFRRFLRQIERTPSVSTVHRTGLSADPLRRVRTSAAAAAAAAAAAPPVACVVMTCPRRPRGLVALEVVQVQAARSLRRPAFFARLDRNVV